MIKDIEPILRVLSNYLQHLVLSQDELDLLGSWLMAFEANLELFGDISNKPKWIKECPLDISLNLTGSMERIRRRVIENLENE